MIRFDLSQVILEKLYVLINNADGQDVLHFGEKRLAVDLWISAKIDLSQKNKQTEGT